MQQVIRKRGGASREASTDHDQTESAHPSVSFKVRACGPDADAIRIA